MSTREVYPLWVANGYNPDALERRYGVALVQAQATEAGRSAEAGQSLVVKGLQKTFEANRQNVAAVSGVSFEVGVGDFYTLLGPSGCGKTTTLRCVAGLERTTAGTISIAGSVVSSHSPRVFVPPNKRDIGMVFQSYAIWPHMTVFDNVAFALRTKNGPNRKELERRVKEALELVDLADYEKRMATQMSGGQQQRLALARALVRRPKLLLLDEPLSNLDAKLRDQMRAELRAIQRQVNITTLYVTHDQAEALSMSSRIAVMEQGKIVQEGTAREIYQHPTSRFVAQFVGSANFIDGTVVSADETKGVCIDTPAGRLVVESSPVASQGQPITVSIRPENVRMHTSDPGRPNTVQGKLERRMFLGEVIDWQVRIGDTFLASRAHPSLEVRRGDDVFVELPSQFCMLVSAEGVSSRAYGTDE
jgi:iron(III) transport system ATP-binding protein